MIVGENISGKFQGEIGVRQQGFERAAGQQPGEVGAALLDPALEALGAGGVFLRFLPAKHRLPRLHGDRRQQEAAVGQQ